MARPRGSIGIVAQAMLAAAKAKPGTVLELARRAQVGQAVAAYTVTRLVQAGHLQRVNVGRPAVLKVAETRADAVQRLRDQLADLQCSFWAG